MLKYWLEETEQGATKIIIENTESPYGKGVHAIFPSTMEDHEKMLEKELEYIEELGYERRDNNDS